LSWSADPVDAHNHERKDQEMSGFVVRHPRIGEVLAWLKSRG
jgi:hypothetical protein